MISKFEFILQRGLVLSRCIKIINLITSPPFAVSGKETHQWDFENIFTEAEAGSVTANIGFCREGSKWVKGTLDTEKMMTKRDHE